MAIFLRKGCANLSRRSLLLSALIGSSLLATVGRSWAVTVRGDRWLAIADLLGNVQFITGKQRRSAQKGDRLASVGDTLITSDSASARLAIDEAIGSVTMAQNSHLRIQSLSITQNGGRVTELAVVRGQVRLRVRPFTNPESRLEIHTPVGISGVRGTDFGVTVQPDGQTAIVTETGSVAASAQGETVLVGPGLQSIIRIGQPPTPVEAFRDDPTLQIEELKAISRSSAQLIGYTDPVNIVKVNGETQLFDEEGRFDWEVSIPSDRLIRAEVITPLGTQQDYQLVVP
ncbi:MAG: FecR domain-containing protein [Phormidesmis sp.]